MKQLDFNFKYNFVFFMNKYNYTMDTMMWKILKKLAIIK